MKNRELMRLNKVLHKGEVKTIDCMSPGYVSFIEDVPKDAAFGQWVDLDEVEFINLVEHLLIKYLPDYKSYGIWNNGDSINFSFGSESNLELRFVHQFQNLYSTLTGEGLVINNGI